MVGTTLLASFGSSIVQAASFGRSISTDDYSYEAPVANPAGQKILKQFLGIVKQTATPALAALKNDGTKRYYQGQLRRFVTDLQDNYIFNYSPLDYIDEIKGLVRDYKSILQEMRTVAAAGGSNQISADEKAKSDAELLAIQKDAVAYAREAMEWYDNKGVKETGNGQFDVTFPKGSVHVGLSKYSSILSFVTGEQEFDATIDGTFHMTEPTYSYDEESTTSVSTDVTATGSFRFDGNVKITKDSWYLSLRDYALDIKVSDPKEQKKSDDELAKMKKTLDAFKGKVIQGSLNDGSLNGIDSKMTFAKIKQIVDILNVEPIFTVGRKVSGRFSLVPNRTTIDAISQVLGEASMTDEDYTNTVNESAQVPVWLELTPTGSVISFSKKNVNNSIDWKLIHGASYDLSIQSNFQGGSFSLHYDVKSFESHLAANPGVKADVIWKDQTLNAQVSAMMQNVSIAGLLSKDNGNVDVTFNGKKLGNTTWKKTGNTTDYSMDFSFDIPNFGGIDSTTSNTVGLKSSGSKTIERLNDVKIDIPTNAVKYENSPKLPADFSDL